MCLLSTVGGGGVTLLRLPESCLFVFEVQGLPMGP